MAVEMDQFRLRLWSGRLHAFKGFVQDGCGVVGFPGASVDGIIRSVGLLPWLGPGSGPMHPEYWETAAKKQVRSFSCPALFDKMLF